MEGCHKDRHLATALNLTVMKKSIAGPVTPLPDNDQVYLRPAETYLLLAEAQFRLNDLSGAAATLKIVRLRSNPTPVTPAQVDLNCIPDERPRELVTEKHRRYTLLRTGNPSDRTELYNVYAGTKISCAPRSSDTAARDGRQPHGTDATGSRIPGVTRQDIGERWQLHPYPFIKYPDNKEPLIPMI